MDEVWLKLANGDMDEIWQLLEKFVVKCKHMADICLLCFTMLAVNFVSFLNIFFIILLEMTTGSEHSNIQVWEPVNSWDLLFFILLSVCCLFHSTPALSISLCFMFVTVSNNHTKHNIR